MLTHRVSYATADRVWSVCGLCSTPTAPLVVGDPPSCLWCMADRSQTGWDYDPISRIIEMNSVKELQALEDQKFIDIVVEELKKR